MSQKEYQKLTKLLKQAALLGSATSLLEWDQETYMPPEGISLRSEMLEILSGLAHKQKTSKQIGKLLHSLTHATDLKTQQKACLREVARDYKHATCLPNAFVKKLSETTSQATHIWQTARTTNDFALFAPHLEKVISLHRKKADLLGYSDHPYNALLDLYEPGLTVATLNPLFTRLQSKLSSLLSQIAKKPPTNDSCLYVSCSQDQQLKLASHFLDAVHLTKQTSRLDLSAHPFCMGLHPRDIRMTTALRDKNPLFCFFSVLHEAGHALYDQGLPFEHYGTPLGEAISLGIHESQSRFWETRIGQSLPFWKHFFPLFQKELPEAFGNISLDTFYKAVNTVTPSCIRIEADEVTYNLHIILRFEIEKKLMEGSLSVKEIPELWNHLMEQYLNVTPTSFKEGCLQDVHWSCGLIGYFPTYTLGNLFASQFFEVFAKDFPDWESKVASGNLFFIREWLKEKIHIHGREFTADELCQRICGKPLSEEAFTRHLESKYL